MVIVLLKKLIPTKYICTQIQTQSNKALYKVTSGVSPLQCMIGGGASNTYRDGQTWSHLGEGDGGGREMGEGDGGGREGE